MMKILLSLGFFILFFVPNIFTQTESSPSSSEFLSCYTYWVYQYIFSFNFIGQPLFLTEVADPKFIDHITEVCNFYYEKTGKWVNGSLTDPNIVPYEKELAEKLKTEGKTSEKLMKMVELFAGT